MLPSLIYNSIVVDTWKEKKTYWNPTLYLMYTLGSQPTAQSRAYPIKRSKVATFCVCMWRRKKWSTIMWGAYHSVTCDVRNMARFFPPPQQLDCCSYPSLHSLVRSD